MVSYTKGPWRRSPHAPNGGTIERFVEVREIKGTPYDYAIPVAAVMHVDPDNGGDAVFRAVGDLILAAPALLEAAQQVIEHYGPDAWLNELTAAVEQALGEDA